MLYIHKIQTSKDINI